MPSFRFLPPARIRELAVYVRHLAQLDGKPSGATIQIPPVPTVTPELVAEGKKLYGDMGCPACHGNDGKGDGAASPLLKDEWGAADPARDLTQGPYHGGDRLADVYLRLTAGIPGTPMPGYAAAATDQQRWAVAAYLESIRQPAPAAPKGDPVKLGEFVLAKYHCLACHQLKGAGGRVGPPLDSAARKLRPEWLESYLANPRLGPKVYLNYAQRMPQQFLSGAEIDAVIAYLTSIAKPIPASPASKAAADPAAQRTRGEAIFKAQCLPCHSLGRQTSTVIRQPPGPDLSRAPQRLQVEWLLNWAQTHAGSDAAVPELSAADAAAVQRYVWNAK